jgi:hypothetical protein
MCPKARKPENVPSATEFVSLRLTDAGGPHSCRPEAEEIAEMMTVS